MKLYLRTFSISFAALLVLSALSSYWFDPFGYFRINGWRSSSLLGDRVWGSARVRNALLLPVAEPETLVVGTSRVGFGIDVDDPAVKHHVGFGLNLGIPGASFDEMDAYTRYAIGNHPPRTLLIGLDFGEFFTTYNNAPSFLQEVAGESSSYFSLLRRFSYVLWSKDAIRNTMRIAFEEHDSSQSGTFNRAVGLEYIRKRGLHGNVLATEANMVSVWKQRSDWDSYSERLASLDKLLNDACNQGIDVRLFISPYHVRQLLLLDSMDLWSHFLSWKRRVTQIIDGRDQSSCKLTLIDFSRITLLTSESFSLADKRQDSAEWFFESSHYKHALGVKIVERLWGMESAPVDFGVELNSETIEQEILQMRNELKRYKEDHPEVADELRKLAERY
ncbi:MAG: hypothetical protein ABW116_02635 [Candidatus Sedimenticola sp. 20ELBAFRAG]